MKLCRTLVLHGLSSCTPVETYLANRYAEVEQGFYDKARAWIATGADDIDVSIWGHAECVHAAAQ